MLKHRKLRTMEKIELHYLFDESGNSKKTLARKLVKTLYTAEQIDGHSHPEEVGTFHGTIFPIFWMKINSIHAENLDNGSRIPITSIHSHFRLMFRL